MAELYLTDHLSFPKTNVKPGDYFISIVGCSEVCIHLRIAGNIMLCQYTLNRMVQFYEHQPNKGFEPYSFPVSAGEGGVFWDGENNFVYGSKSIVTKTHF